MFIARFGAIGSSNTSGVSYDSDALAFFTATGITDSTIKSAINTLVVSAKSNGWWSLCIAIYPMVGGTGTTCKYNLKDPRDLDAAYRLSFTGGWTFSSTGALPDSDHADTHLIPDGILSPNDCHLSFYSRTSTAGTSARCELGAADDGYLPLFTLSIYLNDDYPNEYEFNSGTYVESDGALKYASNNSTGFFLGSRTSSSAAALYHNSSQVATNTNTNAATNLSGKSIYISALNANGSPVEVSDRECAFATIGTGINSTIAALMYSDIQAFQTTLGR